MTDKPKGRSMKELRAIIAEETARRDRLTAAWDVLGDDDQARVLAQAHALIDRRLESLRAAIRTESISYGEIAELQDLSDYIKPGDVELAQWAGIPEEEFNLR